MQIDIKKFDIQIIWFYKDIDGLVLVTCRFQVKFRPIVKDFTLRVNQNNFARNFCKFLLSKFHFGRDDLLPV